MKDRELTLVKLLAVLENWRSYENILNIFNYFFVGCANLDQGGEKVRLVSQDYVEKNNCKFVSAVSNSIDYFGDDWQVALRNEVAKLGGIR